MHHITASDSHKKTKRLARMHTWTISGNRFKEHERQHRLINEYPRAVARTHAHSLTHANSTKHLQEEIAATCRLSVCVVRIHYEDTTDPESAGGWSVSLEPIRAHRPDRGWHGERRAFGQQSSSYINSEVMHRLINHLKQAKWGKN